MDEHCATDAGVGGSSPSAGANSGVAPLVKQKVAAKIRELGYLMEHCTAEDAGKAPEMARWFDAYLARASPAEARAVRAGVRKLWPRCAVLLMGQAGSSDPERAAAAKLDLEKMGSLREGGRN